MKQIRVLYIHGGSVLCGVATHILHLMTFVDRLACEPHLALLHDGEVAEAARRKSIPFTVMRREQGRSLSLVCRLRKYMRRHRIDLLHTHTFNGNFYGRTAALMPPTIPVVTSIHTNMTAILEDFLARGAWKRLLLWQNRLLDRSARRLIVPSEAMLQLALKWGIPAERLRVIPNGIDLSQWASTAEERNGIRHDLGLSDDAFLLGFIGRFVAVKNARALIEVMAKLRPQHRRLRLVMVGDGPERPALERLAEEHALSDVILFTGFRSDVSRVLAAIDLYVHAAREESFGYTVVEAMAAGKPVVAFDTGGLAELVANAETGYLVLRDDVDAMARAVLALLLDPAAAARFGAAGRTRCERLYSAEVMADKMIQLYRDVMKSRAR